MTNFRDLFDYNEWANNQLLAVTDTLPAADLAAPMPELGGSAVELLEHYSLVEAAFLALMTGDAARRPAGERPYGEIKQTFATTAAGYSESLPGLLARLEETFHVPWFGRTFTVEQGLLQVVTHSVQHRAGVAAGIARAGAKAPNLDYIIWLSQHR